MNNVYFSTKLLFNMLQIYQNYQSVNSMNKFYHLSTSRHPENYTYKKLLYYKKATLNRFKHICCCNFTIEKSDSFCLGHQPGPGQGKIITSNPQSALTFIQKQRQVNLNGSGGAGDLLRESSENISFPFFRHLYLWVENKLQVIYTN